ncbi:unnamed protein product [Lactuca virosa]|uniref:Transposase-associated domain-containing protein n=1 Tax=Lactuca virosa TaxID=75947 RepID=A0AAU9MW97_9ASTR|nr:unnamed protein product [Lactuca virosa]
MKNTKKIRRRRTLHRFGAPLPEFCLLTQQRPSESFRRLLHFTATVVGIFHIPTTTTIAGSSHSTVTVAGFSQSTPPTLVIRYIVHNFENCLRGLFKLQPDEMSQNREWMYTMRLTKDGRFNSGFGQYVHDFLEFAYTNATNIKPIIQEGMEVFQIRCPCWKCKNRDYNTREIVAQHLYDVGFVKDYSIWHAHGELYPTQEIGQSSNPIPSQVMAQEINNHVGDFPRYQQMVIESMYGPEVPYYQQGPQHPNQSAQTFFKLVNQANEPLWDGSLKASTLSTTTRLLNWKSECNVSDSSFDRLLPIIKDSLPTGAKLPDNFYETKKMLKPLKLPSQRIHVCKNHCMLFNGHHSNLDHCLVCNECRYTKIGGKVPNLVMTYMPIGPRLQRKLGLIKRRIRNKARVEGSIINEHLVNELATYCSLYFAPTIETRHNREPRNFAPQHHNSLSEQPPLSVFALPSRRSYPYIQEFDEVAPRMYQGEQVASLRDKYFAQWFEQKVRLNSDGSAKHLEALARKPEQYDEYHNGYFVNESDYYGLVDEILEIKYYGIGPSTVVLFKCTWFDNNNGVIVNKNKMVDVKYKSRLQTNDPFCLASQAEQVFYTPYPAMTRETKDLWAVVKTKPRGVFEVTQDEIDADGFFQIDERFELPNERGISTSQQDQHEEQLEDEDDIEDNGNELVYSDDGSDYDEE